MAARRSNDDDSGSAPPWAYGLPASHSRGTAVALLHGAAQTLVCGVLAAVSATVTHLRNDTHVWGGEKFLAAYDAREADRGIVTVSNHVTAVDDPGIIVPLLRPQWLLTPGKLRWTLCATDRCFRDPFTAALLRHGRVLPVERGKGPTQPFMGDVVSRLDAGDWVHMFPEGARQPPGTLGRMRAGVGRLIADAARTPVVVPIYHRGLHNVQPKGSFLPSGSGNRVDIIVGDALDLSPQLRAWRSAGVAERDIHTRIAERIGDELAALKAQLEAKPELGPEAPALLLPSPPPPPSVQQR